MDAKDGTTQTQTYDHLHLHLVDTTFIQIIGHVLICYVSLPLKHPPFEVIVRIS